MINNLSDIKRRLKVLNYNCDKMEIVLLLEDYVINSIIFKFQPRWIWKTSKRLYS